ncbi:hypothetical protein ACEOPV_05475, partial [Pseudomonas aeruginosa]
NIRCVRESDYAKLEAEAQALREELQSQRERNTELIFKLGSATNGWGRCEKERDAALARAAELEGKLAELEKQEPIQLQHMAVAEDGELRWMTGRKIDNCELYAMPDFGRAPKLYAAPIAQADQLHALDKQCRDDVARALGLTPQGDGYAWSALLADIKTAAKVAQAGQVPEECAPGTYAIDYLDNWDGEGDRYFCIAEKTADGKWIRQESGQELLEYKGDAILAAWLLAASEAQERDK